MALSFKAIGRPCKPRPIFVQTANCWGMNLLKLNLSTAPTWDVLKSELPRALWRPSSKLLVSRLAIKSKKKVLDLTTSLCERFFGGELHYLLTLPIAMSWQRWQQGLRAPPLATYRPASPIFAPLSDFCLFGSFVGRRSLSLSLETNRLLYFPLNCSRLRFVSWPDWWEQLVSASSANGEKRTFQQLSELFFPHFFQLSILWFGAV